MAGKLWDQPLAQGEVGAKHGEIAVVDPDKRRAVGQGAGEIWFVMNLEECIKPGGLGGRGEGFDFLVNERADDDENRAGTGLAGLQHLQRMQHEVLPQAGSRRGLGPEPRRHPAQVLEAAAKVFLVGQDGERIGAGRLVTLRLIQGRGASLDVTRGWRAPLDLGDDRQPAIAPAQVGGERRRPRHRAVHAAELGLRDDTDQGRDLAPLPGHDFRERVRHSGESPPRGRSGARNIPASEVFSALRFAALLAAIRS